MLWSIKRAPGVKYFLLSNKNQDSCAQLPQKVRFSTFCLFVPKKNILGAHWLAFLYETTGPRFSEDLVLKGRKYRAIEKIKPVLIIKSSFTTP